MRGNSLRKMQQRFDGLKLNVKFMLLIILFIEITVGIFSGFLFWNMERSVVRQKINGLEYAMDRQHVQIRKNVESINMSTQFFLNDQELLDFLVAIKQGKNIPAEEIKTFYHENIASMERLVNSNLLLYQIRVYVEDDSMQEMMPVLYTRERMERLAWAQDDELAGFKFDYIDSIFDTYTVAQNHKIMSLVTPIKDYDNGELAILEVAMPMETMFEELYHTDTDMAGCFLDEERNPYYGAGDGQDSEMLRAILEMPEVGSGDCFFSRTIHGKKVVAGCIGVKELSGMLVCMQDISGEVGRIRTIRNFFIVLMILLIPFLAAGVNMLVKTLLQRFYKILKAMKQVQSGDLNVVIENCGTDEMGEMGNQFNLMISEIKRLMEDNINRELLVKNSEIKALQNQINVHFIYNVLESIKMMAEIEEKYDISDAITSLGKLLRYSMRWTSGNVTVREEIDYIKNYLKLINLRFDYEIYLSLNIPEEVYGQRIPKMSLQPIVENAIYHGIEQLAEDTNIYIKGRVEKDCCIVEIMDAGKGMSEEEVTQLYKRISGEVETAGGTGNGIGLKNVQDRIRMNFGDSYGIEIASKPGCYTKVSVRVPFMERPA